jgi:hypothetical protein
MILCYGQDVKMSKRERGEIRKAQKLQTDRDQQRKDMLA